MGYFELSLIIFGLAIVYEFFAPRNEVTNIDDENGQVVFETKNRNNSMIFIWMVGLLIFILSFHIFLGNNGVTIFPKSYFTFSNSIITQSDVNQLIDKYNNLEQAMEVLLYPTGKQGYPA
ncbi:MAG: hypothetical protein IM449_16945 [Microcystis sp. M065S1]|jgi:hypothetical protein|nr:hypothetical protein [Microcystis sp. M065S1]